MISKIRMVCWIGSALCVAVLVGAACGSPKITAPERPVELTAPNIPSGVSTFTTDDGSAQIDAKVEAGILLHALPEFAKEGVLALGILDGGDYSPLMMDGQGYLLFSCRKCPNKFCKELACTFSMVEPGNMQADCKCMESQR